MRVNALIDYFQEPERALSFLGVLHVESVPVSALEALALHGGTRPRPGVTRLYGRGGAGGVRLPTRAECASLQEGDVLTLWNESTRRVSVRVPLGQHATDNAANADIPSNSYRGFQLLKDQWRVGQRQGGPQAFSVEVGGFTPEQAAAILGLPAKVMTGGGMQQQRTATTIVRTVAAINIRLKPATLLGEIRAICLTPNMTPATLDVRAPGKWLGGSQRAARVEIETPTEHTMFLFRWFGKNEGWARVGS